MSSSWQSRARSSGSGRAHETRSSLAMHLLVMALALLAAHGGEQQVAATVGTAIAVAARGALALAALARAHLPLRLVVALVRGARQTGVVVEPALQHLDLGVLHVDDVARQMIPHHQNAVSMAKSLIKFHGAADYANAGATDPEEDDHAAAESLARNIINVQNAQIQMLQGWLDNNPGLAGASHKCYDQPEGEMCSGKGGKGECPAGSHCDCGAHRRRHLLFASMGSKQCKCHHE